MSRLSFYICEEVLVLKFHIPNHMVMQKRSENLELTFFVRSLKIGRHLNIEY